MWTDGTFLTHPSPMKGMLTKLTGLLGLEGQPETLVRVLMALAMLLGDGAELLRELAQAPKAIDRLAAIIRSSEDPDSKAIATSIFANLASLRLLSLSPQACSFELNTWKGS